MAVFAAFSSSTVLGHGRWLYANMAKNNDPQTGFVYMGFSDAVPRTVPNDPAIVPITAAAKPQDSSVTLIV